MMSQAICRELATRNGGPGLTADELSARLGSPAATVRNHLAGLVFRDMTVTVEPGRAGGGRYKIGDSSALLGLD
jgi:predicted ArsR family transcriptional regulator